MPSKHERRITRRYDARRTALEQQQARQKADAKRNKMELEAPARRQLILDIKEHVARLLAIYDEDHWGSCETIRVPRKVFGSKPVPALNIGKVLIPIKHVRGNVSNLQQVMLTVSGDFYGEDYTQYALVDLGQVPLAVLEEILHCCQQLPKTKF